MMQDLSCGITVAFWAEFAFHPDDHIATFVDFLACRVMFQSDATFVERSPVPAFFEVCSDAGTLLKILFIV